MIAPRSLKLLTLIVVLLAGCESGIQHMGATEYGVRFRKLPPFLGGGEGGEAWVASPLETIVVMPWENVVRFDTAPQYLSWERKAPSDIPGDPAPQDEDVHTRARDGNEAALKISVRYRIKPNPESLVRLAQEVTSNAEGVQELVVTVVRSEIRTSMNTLRTSEYRDDTKRNAAVDEALSASQKVLDPWGIDVESINLKQYRFVRLLADGQEDTRYQERLREIQELEQDIEGERSRIESARALKQKEFLEAQSTYNQRIAEAKGVKDQATYSADAYFNAKSNEAKAIRAEGTAEIEGLRKQIAALAGPGGEALVKLEVAKQLSQGDARFVSVDQGSGTQTLGVQRTDVNTLLQQLGVLEAQSTPAPVPAQR